jgi:hypothetical protein
MPAKLWLARYTTRICGLHKHPPVWLDTGFSAYPAILIRVFRRQQDFKVQARAKYAQILPRQSLGSWRLSFTVPCTEGK